MDIISIEGLVVHGNHGVLEEENRLGQRFIISAKLCGDLSQAKQSDEVDDTVNYALVCDLIEDITKNNTYNLIEALAHNIAYKILGEFELFDYVEVTVKKPFAPIRQALDMVSVTVKEKRHIVYLSLGSNIGDKKGYLDKAIQGIDEDKLTKVRKVATYIETAPYGYTDQDNFLNTAVEIATLREPYDLLELIDTIEQNLKRERTIHWGPRTIDIDIILFDDIVLQEDKLTIPHKEMDKREFVLRPLCELNPTIVHPCRKETVYNLLQNIINNN